MTLEVGLFLRHGELAAEPGRTVGWRELREQVRLAEDVGFGAIWVEDHVLFRDGPATPMPLGETRGAWECFTLLAALAQATERIQLGPFVACTSFRSPTLLAKMVETLDEISGGRVRLGLGAGWNAPDFDALGLPFDSLASRFEEALHIIATLLRQGEIDFQGKFYRAQAAVLRPRGPRPQGLPIWIGARRPRLMALAARYADAFNTAWHSNPGSAGASFHALTDACHTVGRNPSSIVRTVGCHVAMPAPGEHGNAAPPGALTGSAREVADGLRAFEAEGVAHVTVTLTPWRHDTLERFGSVIQHLDSSALT